MLEELLDLYTYNRWAHERTLGAAAALTREQYECALGGSFPSLRATMEHLIGAEGSWLARWNGAIAGVRSDFSECVDVNALRSRWEAHWEVQERFLGNLTERDLGR